MRLFLCSALVISLALQANASSQFNRFFSEKTMRVDYFHTGTKGSETFSLDEVLLEGEWPGSKGESG